MHGAALIEDIAQSVVEDVDIAGGCGAGSGIPNCKDIRRVGGALESAAWLAEPLLTLRLQTRVSEGWWTIKRGSYGPTLENRGAHRRRDAHQ
jgi:hypothetical protein